METVEIAEIAELRRKGYELLSLLFLYPTREREKAAIALARELRQHPRYSAVFPFFTGWERLLDGIELLRGNGRVSLEEEYSGLFLSGAAAVLPLESAFRASGAEGIARIVGGLEREYTSAGLELATDLTEAPDHAAVELGFLAQLCAEEMAAWKARSLEEGLRLLRREAAFLHKHPSAWLPAFERSVRERDPGSRYAVFAEVAASFVAFDLDRTELILKLAERGWKEKSHPGGGKAEGGKAR